MRGEPLDNIRLTRSANLTGRNNVRNWLDRVFAWHYACPMDLDADRCYQIPEHSLSIPLQLGFRGALAWSAMTGFLNSRATGRTERLLGDRYMRSMRVGGHAGWIAARPATPGVLQVDVCPSLLPVLPELQVRLRRLFDLDANPAIIENHLAQHPFLSELIQRCPGLRVPGAIDGFELALRAILGQQITVKAATTIFGRFVEVFGKVIATPFPEIDRLPPSAEVIANARLQQLIDRGLTRRRAETVSLVARAVAEGVIRFDPSMDAAEVRRRLRDIPGIGEWTVEYIALRGLGDPDAFPHSDLGLMRALKVEKPGALAAVAEAWRPWRAYAALHVWNSLGAGSAKTAAP